MLCNFIRKRLQDRCFHMNTANFRRNLRMAASEKNDKNGFLGKATSHNDHYMVKCGRSKAKDWR